MEVLVIVVVAAVLLFVMKVRSDRRQEEREEVFRMRDMAQKSLSRAHDAAGVTTKVKHYKKAAEIIAAARKYDCYSSIIKNGDQLVTELDLAVRVLPVVALLEKAEKARFKGSAGSEKNALAEALYLIESTKVTQGEIDQAMLSIDADVDVEVSAVTDRLAELGWKRPV